LSNYTIQPGLNQIDINILADSHDYNLLLIAAEQGDPDIVKILLQLGMISDLLHIDAQTLAWDKHNHDVLLELLKANLTYPNSFDIKKCSAELKEFYKHSDDLHKAIKANNQEETKAILNRNLDLKYYYNSSNDSALKTAIDAKSPDIYDILLEHKIRFAPHEDAEELYSDLEQQMKRTLREIHNKYTQVSDEKHLNILLANSFVSHDDENAQKKVEHIQRAFRILNANVFIRIILMIVAASKKFKIIFDFNRDSVNVADPTVESNTQGLFYLSGRIYIGAKQLLDKSTEHEAFGVLAHELCHFAMNVVYGNEANPYTANDNQTMQEFEQVSKKCREKSVEDKIVDLVYTHYPEERYHAELIVRVVHMLAFYYNQPEKLKDLRGFFGGLFNFYETKTVPEMKAAHPKIEEKVELEIKKKDKKISNLRILLFISIGLGIVIACFASLYFYKPVYKFSELSDREKETVQNGLVKYKNVNVKLNELFPGNSDIFEHLTSDHISLMLHDKVLNFHDPQFRYLEEQIVLKWENLAEKLKEKFLDSDLNFEGEIVKFKNLINLYPKSFNALTSKQLISVLSGIKIKAGKKFVSEIKFYIERKFILEDAKLIIFEYAYGHEYVDNYETRAEHVENRTKNKNFQEFADELLKKDFDEISQLFDKTKQNSFLKTLNFNLIYESLNFMHKDSNEIIEQSDKEKILILSSEYGAGKTVTFEQLSMEIKAKFPTRWVSYIDLPKHTKYYKTNGTAENLLKDILELNSEKNNFEVRIFEESFKSGNLVLIWNAFDEISPTYSDLAELRLELFYALIKSYGDVPQITTDFMTSYLQMRPHVPQKFNPTISKLLRTKFKNFFMRMLDTNYPKVFEFLFEFFKPDHDLLVDLLHVFEPETLYTAIFNPNHFALATNPEEIKSLARKCLTDAEFQKFLTGKNQKGKILFGIHFYGLLGVTKSNDAYSTEIKALSGTSFWDFFPKIKDSLTVGEQKELFVAALSPKIYLFYDKMFSTADLSEYEKLWTNFENLLTQNEIQDALGDALVLYFEIYQNDKADSKKFLNLLLEKVEKFLTNFQIFEMFLTKNILHEAHWNADSFEILWNFLNNHTNDQEQRQILLQDDLDDKNFYFYSLYYDSKKSYSSFKYPYFYYDFAPFKIFHRALTIPDGSTFDFTKQIYQKHFSKSEIEEIILSSNDFLYYAIVRADEESFKKFVSFLEELFEGNEKLLKEFLEPNLTAYRFQFFGGLLCPGKERRCPEFSKKFLASNKF